MQMQSQLFTFPDIEAVAFSIGPLDIRWYALSYITGIILGWLFLRRQIKTSRSVLSMPQLDSLLNSSIFGIIIGGRLGYVIFYNPSLYLAEPLAILRVWEGGMSFHGGMIGVIGAIFYCSHRFGLKPLALGDEIGVIAPIGLFFGRIANFINGELFGRVTSHPFGIVFPRGGPELRHPSQLYEAVFEGAILFILLLILVRIKRHTGLRDGVILSGFLAGYGLARFCIEFVREPDRHIGFIAEAGFLSITMGQILTLPMIFIGIAGMVITIRTRPSGRGT
jgi:phosphatidylglycerol:prolipoprotein diacylglycerol transferase